MVPDSKIVIWRSYRAYVGHFWSRTATFAVVSLLGGVAWPLMLLNVGAAQMQGYSRLMDFCLFFVCHLFSATVSSSVFGMERRHSTIHAVLGSPLRAEAMFAGNWAWLMGISTLLFLTMSLMSRACLFFSIGVLWNSVDEFLFSLGVGFFSLSYVSWVIAANSLISLVLRDSRLGQFSGTILIVLPVVFVVSLSQGSLQTIGLQGLAMGAVFCFVLAAGSFLGATAAFRSEHIRY